MITLDWGSIRILNERKNTITTKDPDQRNFETADMVQAVGPGSFYVPPLADPQHEMHDGLRDWLELGKDEEWDAQSFDLDAAKAAVATV